MSADLSREDARAVARVLFGIHQRRAARLAAEQQSRDESPADDERTDDTADVGGDAA
jgi:hypothetical protein